MNSVDDNDSLLKSSGVRFVKGSISGFAAACILQPLAVIKTSMQITPIHCSTKFRDSRPPITASITYVKYQEVHMKIALKKHMHLPHYDQVKPSTKGMNARQAARTIYHTEGIKGFTRGLSASLIKNSLMTGQFFAILFYFETLLRRMETFTNTQVQFLAGSLTKSIQSVLVNPITVVKTRLEVIGFNEYSGIGDACRKIYRNEGIHGFFTGLRISLIRDVPFSGIFYPIYS